MINYELNYKIIGNGDGTFTPDENLTYNIGNFKLNCQSQTLSFNGSTEELSYMECGILRQLAANIDKGEVWEKVGENRWECRNCGHIHYGDEAPEVCPTCNHPQAYFERRVENY